MKSKTSEDGSYHTAQVGPGSRGMEWIGFGFDLDLIWIEIGVFKNFKECARSPCNGNHFSSILLNKLLIVFFWHKGMFTHTHTYIYTYTKRSLSRMRW